MTFFIRNWPAIASALIALSALAIAARVAWENRRYRAPAFRITAAEPSPSGIPRLALTNTGESRAKDVKLILDFDPLEVFASEPRAWEVMDKGETVIFGISGPPTIFPTPDTAWISRLIAETPALRGARIEYKHLVGRKPVREQLLLPNTEQLNAVWVHGTQGSDSQ